MLRLDTFGWGMVVGIAITLLLEFAIMGNPLAGFAP